MGTALGRTLGRCCGFFPYQRGSHRSTTTTFYQDYYTHHNAYNMPKGRPLSLQVRFRPMYFLLLVLLASSFSYFPQELLPKKLKVRMCCEGCVRVVKDAIMKLRGVDSVEVNLPMEKVTVIGYLDRNKVLKAVRRHGKKAEFWPNPDLPLYFTSAANYWHDEETYRQSYNYWRHGYNGDRHGRIPVPQRGDDRVSNMFNDDDVNACSIM